MVVVVGGMVVVVGGMVVVVGGMVVVVGGATGVVFVAPFPPHPARATTANIVDTVVRRMVLTPSQ